MARRMTDGGKQGSEDGKLQELNIISRLLTFILCLLITVYRHSLSYFLGSNCRFLPTCSVYADEAIRLHGPIKGGWLALRRLGRCHPWGGKGYDPVPDGRKQGLGIRK